MATTRTELPPTPGYEISRFEVRQFCAALGLDPAAVLSLHIEGKRVIARVAESGPPADPQHPEHTIVVPIKETR